MKQYLFLMLQFLTFSSLLHSQYAPGTNWKQIETENFIIIFPEEITAQALETAEKIDAVYAMDAQVYEPVRQSKWPLILTSAGMEANGYVSMPPRKSVWYGTPIAEDLPPMKWFDLLALHETRHMVQYDALNRRLNRVLFYLYGQTGLVAGIFLGVPTWFFEGDAVGAETQFSDSGRGRDPLFYQHMKELVLREDFSYQKMVNRSYKYYIPNQYELGYFLTSYIKKEYGEDSWNHILDSPALLPIPALGLYFGARKVTGLSWSQLYKNMAEDLAQQWEEQAARVPVIENHVLTSSPHKDFFLWDPLFLEDDRILARKTSLGEPAVLVEVRPEGERELLRVPSSEDLTAFRDKVVWTFHRPSILHEAVSWSDLVRVDLETGKKDYLTRHERYITPSYNHDGTLLAVCEWTEEMQSSLVILDESTGEERERYPLAEGLFAAYPAWSEDDKSLYFTVQATEGRAIGSFHRESGTYEELTDFSRETIKRVSCSGEYLFYSSNYTGLENVMALNLETREKFQLSSRLNGVRTPLVGTFKGQEVLLYSEYTSIQGEQLALQEFSPELWIPEKDIIKETFLYYPGEDTPEVLPETQGDKGDASPFDPIIEDYSLGAGRFNIHSWIIEPNPEDTGLALSVSSQDVLDTMGWSLGGEVNLNENSQGAFFDLDWHQFYPNILMDNEYWYREINGREYHDISSDLSLSFPMTLDRDLWSHRLLTYAGVGGDSLIPADSSGDPDSSTPLHYGIGWMSVLPGSSRSLNPLWGTVLKSYYKHTPLQSEDRHIFFSRGIVYLPGGLRNTSLSFSGGYESQTGRYQSLIPFSRGYEAEDGDNIFQFTGDYDFPIAYPDWAFGSVMYLKRIWGTLFYDHTGLYEDRDSIEHYRSVGGELNFEFNPLNVNAFPLTFGVCYSWLIEEEKGVVQFVLMTLGV